MPLKTTSLQCQKQVTVTSSSCFRTLRKTLVVRLQIKTKTGWFLTGLIQRGGCHLMRLRLVCAYICQCQVLLHMLLYWCLRHEQTTVGILICPLPLLDASCALKISQEFSPQIFGPLLPIFLLHSNCKDLLELTSLHTWPFIHSYSVFGIGTGCSAPFPHSWQPYNLSLSIVQNSTHNTKSTLPNPPFDGPCQSFTTIESVAALQPSDMRHNLTKSVNRCCGSMCLQPSLATMCSNL